MRSILIAFATYSRIPMPKTEWREKDSRYAICAFPLVGVVIAAAELLLLWGAKMPALPLPATVCLIAALPVLITGGIHLDGFVDTSDARSSYGSREKKLEILKDPHVGAFGIIRLILYFLLAYSGLMILLSMQAGGEAGNAAEAVRDFVPYRGLFPGSLLAATVLPVLSRALSGLSAELLPKAKKDGMLAEMLRSAPEEQGTGKKRQGPVAVTVLILWLIVCIAAILYTDPAGGAAVLLAEAVLLLYYRRMCKKEFGGVTGDLAGWYLCMAELTGIWALAVCGMVRQLLP